MDKEYLFDQHKDFIMIYPDATDDVFECYLCNDDWIREEYYDRD